MSARTPHPRDVLFQDGPPPALLPVCDHYSGVEARMRKSLALQQQLGPIFDVTLDGEDGAAAGGEIAQARLIAELAASPLNAHGRVGTRLLAVGHPAFAAALDVLLGGAGRRLAYLMIPKARDAIDIAAAIDRIDEAAARAGLERPLPLHALIETHGALRDVFSIAAHPRIASLSFGLMDFVSAHRGAIPQSAMGVTGQFEHPLVVRAKLEIAAACHAHAKTPSHCVVTEFRDTAALKAAAVRAARTLGYTRMWSIHPDQILPIVEALSPTADEVDQAAEIILAADAAGWAPIRHHHAGRDQLHDRASFRYYWQVLERAHHGMHAGGPQLPREIVDAYFSAAPA